MLTPEQVVPFLLHHDPIVRHQVRAYFRGIHQFGPLTADHYWTAIDTVSDESEKLSFASQLSSLPQTQASLHRLLNALNANADDTLQFHFQHAAQEMDLELLQRYGQDLRTSPLLLPHVRQHLDLRLELLSEAPLQAWERLMQHGKSLKDSYANRFNYSESNALIEAAARGGGEVCDLAMNTLADESAEQDWRQIFAVKTLGHARYSPAIDALVEKYSIDTDVLRDEVNRALARIGTDAVIDKIVSFYGGKPWHVRLYADDPLAKIKSPQSEVALLKILDIELALEADPDYDDEGGPLIDDVLRGLTDLCSLAGLQKSQKVIRLDPQDPELLDLSQSVLATAIMHGVELPEEKSWRKYLRQRNERSARMDKNFEVMAARIRRNWIEKGIHFLDEKDDVVQSKVNMPRLSMLQNDPGDFGIQPFRNDTPKIGRNDPCTCRSGKKYKKCCGK